MRADWEQDVGAPSLNPKPFGIQRLSGLRLGGFEKGGF